ncbi:hypothetical protein [Rubricoccus marinus]|uniref:Uncharacterized protein n=1 Tax=Rubricoccus marinus TaxID=716817 RepID=A0A259U1Z2_9BACT|nr:hypothetical protein [Rubricoccus marinus]OZC04019.1 hypothetical protein BSZ36_14125 [Rubricoccus marinus]
MPRTAPLSASDFDALHTSHDAPEAAPECSYCGAEDAPLFPVHGETLCRACLRELEAERAADYLASAPSHATYSVARRAQSERFDPKTAHIVARFLTRPEADQLSRILRESEPDAVFTTFASPLADQMEAALAPEAITPEARAVAASGSEAREGLEAPAVAGAVADGAVFARLTREDAVEADAADVYAHWVATGATFPLGLKMERSEAYSVRAGASSLRIPSKLSGVSGLQGRIATAAAHVEASGAAPLPTVLHVTPEGDGQPSRIAVLAAPHGDNRDETRARRGAVLVGYIQQKHAAWLGPLLRASGAGTVTREGTPVRVRITAVTGGTAERTTRGVNVEILGVANAVRGLWREAEREMIEEEAYASGSRAAVEAAMV